MIIVFGIGEASKYAIIAIGVVYIIIINTVSGVRNIDKIYLDVGRNYHASRLMMFTDVALPGALPMIIAGMKISMGVSLILIVSARIARREKRHRLPDLDDLAGLRGREDVCRTLYGRGARRVPDRASGLARARANSVETHLNGR